MLIDGIEVDDLPAQFEHSKTGTLVLDGDGFLYEACSNVATLPTAVRKAKIKIFEAQFLAKCSTVRVHLTARGCWKAGRKLLMGVKPYQGNREHKAKPPLLEPLREELAREGCFLEHEGVDVFLHRDVEADDAMMFDAYTIPDAVVWSPDKDLRIVPCPWYDVNTGKLERIPDRYGWVRYDADLGKCIGRGTAFFWAQMLMGDTADNVQGLRHIREQSPVYRPLRFAAQDCSVCAGTGYKGRARGTGKCECLREWKDYEVGPALAAQILSSQPSEDAAANAVLDLYRAINQNPLPEAGMLWLLRTPYDTAEGYIWSLGLSEENRQFVQDCYNREWKKCESSPEDSSEHGQ